MSLVRGDSSDPEKGNSIIIVMWSPIHFRPEYLRDNFP